MSTSPARGANLNAIAEATGLTFEDWAAWLDARGARDLTVHAEIVGLVLERMRSGETAEVGSPEWWAQGVTVAYEQHIGRRRPGQRADGTFAVTASRILEGTREEVHARAVGAVRAALSDGGALRGVGLAKEPTESATATRLFWRAVLADGTRAELATEPRPQTAGKPAKAAVVATHSRAASAEEAAAWKAFWRNLPAAL
ncbi:hypothetical protein KW076_10335 [Micrococcus porci]|uniref:hypothetical protein n=1 Tax=Micrococcus TaxID=1269 RepID=UPI001CCC6884|nr:MULTISPECIES: hypothetical protein [Micrococcus]MCG7421836.1 hypothetical protein [Micrococcus sp. ACRRV]UBH24255.1 hypothetical protein KW076_10335 [Micrococcus porci]